MQATLSKNLKPHQRVIESLIGFICAASINGLILAVALAVAIQHDSGDAGRILGLIFGYPAWLLLNLGAIVAFASGGNRWFALGAFVGLVAATLAFAASVFR